MAGRRPDGIQLARNGREQRSGSRFGQVYNVEHGQRKPRSTRASSLLAARTGGTGFQLHSFAFPLTLFFGYPFAFGYQEEFHSRYMASTRSPPVSSPPQAFSSSSLQRKPTKKSSFLSLRREKKTNDALGPSPAPGNTPGMAYNISSPPLILHASERATSPRPTISHPHELKGSRSKTSTKSIGSMKEVSRRARGETGQIMSPTATHYDFDFPADLEEGLPWPSREDDVMEPRPRATSGHSSKRGWDHEYYSRPIKYPFRDSGSSSMSHFETPPRTPVDDYPYRERSYAVPVVVAAPVPGVETMDALVDGMNGYTEDEQFLSLTGSSSRSHYKKTGYHPLYHPPLPTPPPGVKLGGALPRTERKESESDSGTEGTQMVSRSRSRRERHKKSRSRSSRTASSVVATRATTLASTVASDFASQRPESSLYGADEISLADSYADDISRTTSPIPGPHREIAPSISDIIKAYAPPSQQKRTRPALSRRSSYATSYEGSVPPETFELPPEPALIEEETEMISRSSVDTIAEEVRQTIRNQAKSPVASGRVPYPRPCPPSSASDITRSPLSEGRRDSSLYNFSNISDQPPLPAMDLSGLTKAPINSPSQAIAKYLRSSRLTTMMKLTRSPHASRESPLNVSFADLGSPAGFPLVVFLGLGCVRHIMGLYDEMAECLGIRLITIDRSVEQHLTRLRLIHLSISGGAWDTQTVHDQNWRREFQNGRRSSRKFWIGYTLISVALWLIPLVLLMPSHLPIAFRSASVAKYVF